MKLIEYKEPKVIEDLYLMYYNLKDVYDKNLDIPGMSLLLNHCGYKLYCIERNSTLQSYVGSTKISIHYRFFSSNTVNYSHFQGVDEAPHNLWSSTMYKYNSINKDGLENFTIRILPPSESSTYRINDKDPTIDNDDETYWIDKLKSWYFITNSITNKRGFNTSKDGRGRGWSILGFFNNTTRMYKEGSGARYVPKNKVSYLESKGWSKSGPTKGMRRIYKITEEGTKKYSVVPLDKLLEYLSNGWLEGSNWKDTIWSKTPEGRTTRIPITEIDKYLNKGYILEGNIKDYRRISNGLIESFIHKDSELPHGWRYGVKDTSRFKNSEWQSIQGTKGAIALDKINKELGRAFYDSKVQTSNTIKRNENSIRKALSKLKELGLPLTEENYNKYRPQYLGSILYYKAKLNYNYMFED
jgi:hypothetical protein